MKADVEELLGQQVFEIPWEPTAWARPRAIVRGGRVRFFTGQKHASATAAIRQLLLSSGAVMLSRDVPIALRLTFRVRRPKSAPRRVVEPVTRPDLDQFAKLLLDAGTGVLWVDDAQIVELRARKEFDVSGGASIRVEVERLEAELRKQAGEANGGEEEAVG